jgi:hypothetical protein
LAIVRPLRDYLEPKVKGWQSPLCGLAYKANRFRKWSNMMNKWIKIPLIFGILVAAIQGGTMWFYGGGGNLLNKATFSLIIGCLLGFFLLFISNLYGISTAKGSVEENYDIHQQKVITVYISYDDAFDLCKESLRVIGKSKLKEEDRSAGKIETQTGFTLLSFGEIITYKISKLSEQLTRIEVSSGPIVRTTLIDFGRNLRNVNKIITFLEAIS